MANWIEKINLHGVMARFADEYDLSEHEKPCPQPVLDAMATELEKSVWFRRFSVPLRNARSIAEANRVLARVFDAAEFHRVWCGMPGAAIAEAT